MFSIRKDSKYNDVSILVFLDQALKGYSGDGDTIVWIVSILVFLDQALKAWPGSKQNNRSRVSILVFLDQALKEE